jgi:putative flippase GtrA
MSDNISIRAGAFLTVSAIGFVLQIGTLALLTAAAGWAPGWATAVAVTLAVVHNFGWHERWTWHDRMPARGGTGERLVKYLATTGAVSVGGNVAMTAFWAGSVGLPVVVANVLSVATLAIMNFVAADRFVFARSTCADEGPALRDAHGLVHNGVTRP